jgi:hypothetical protein
MKFYFQSYISNLDNINLSNAHLQGEGLIENIQTILDHHSNLKDVILHEIPEHVLITSSVNKLKVSKNNESTFFYLDNSETSNLLISSTNLTLDFIPELDVFVSFLGSISFEL